tara:strand:- start:3988 stop:4257 length:270 start_codon:yes stop_codon:yes gene_type:complete
LEEEQNIKFSELTQEVAAGNTSVNIEIYRLEGQQGWCLEIVDEHGNSTAWDEAFTTDTEALNEAKKTIATDGIQSFIGPEGGEKLEGWI